jgi:hypothetical protein
VLNGKRTGRRVRKELQGQLAVEVISVALQGFFCGLGGGGGRVRRAGSFSRPGGGLLCDAGRRFA